MLGLNVKLNNDVQELIGYSKLLTRCFGWTYFAISGIFRQLLRLPIAFWMWIFL